MAEGKTVAEAAAEVNAATAELILAEEGINKAHEDLFHAERRFELAKLRKEEAQRVLLETASE